ncbi:MBL fold metallo-hydrolase [Loktanella sp. D2R18]|uniref:MBL fold metallo-hydrolase n=1 Tax=Rhodobacterales TaxID=204455 RepID=UPI000DEBC2F7|nr:MULTISPECIES: MBL fold metallo-hydrolase [Rhodobacterales]MDO6591508.1 MBL fold metallo-hydrolase [Yoonia sp. 1_MG-2023]RBW43858.1 MBL fold metallo-hydrolase [Loktanella sp. D2R18]
MSDTLMVTILGCGSSGGVPRLGGLWGDCDPENPKNRRKRCSILLTRSNGKGETKVLIDTSPDLRNQLLDAGVGTLDAVIYTHAHADHVHGIDDLRMIVFNTREMLPVWADPDTAKALRDRFGYIFETPIGSSYPPICKLHEMDGDVTITAAGGAITLTPFTVTHGGIDALGFRFDDVAYIPDVSAIPDPAWAKLDGLACWIIDALRRTPHPSHAHLEQTLNWIAKLQPKQAVLTNMHNDLDFATVAAETPAHVQPAYDGMTLTFDIT